MYSLSCAAVSPLVGPEKRIANRNGKSELIEAPSFLCTVYESAGKYPGLKETRCSAKKEVERKKM